MKCAVVSKMFVLVQPVLTYELNHFLTSKILGQRQTIQIVVMEYVHTLLGNCVHKNRNILHLARFNKMNCVCFTEEVYSEHTKVYNESDFITIPSGYLSFQSSRFLKFKTIYTKLFVLQVDILGIVKNITDIKLNVTLLKFDMPYFESGCASDFVMLSAVSSTDFHNTGRTEDMEKSTKYCGRLPQWTIITDIRPAVKAKFQIYKHNLKFQVNVQFQVIDTIFLVEFYIFDRFILTDDLLKASGSGIFYRLNGRLLLEQRLRFPDQKVILHLIAPYFMVHALHIRTQFGARLQLKLYRKYAGDVFYFDGPGYSSDYERFSNFDNVEIKTKTYQCVIIFKEYNISDTRESNAEYNFDIKWVYVRESTFALRSVTEFQSAPWTYECKNRSCYKNNKYLSTRNEFVNITLMNLNFAGPNIEKCRYGGFSIGRFKLQVCFF